MKLREVVCDSSSGGHESMTSQCSGKQDSDTGPALSSSVCSIACSRVEERYQLQREDIRKDLKDE